MSGIDAQPPIVGANTWTKGMTRAEWCCQRSGACGKRRDRERGSRRNRARRPDGVRCIRENTSTNRLLAMPADPVGEIEAIRLPAEALIAVCPDCHIRITRARQRRAEQAAHLTTEPLF